MTLDEFRNCCWVAPAVLLQSGWRADRSLKTNRVSSQTLYATRAQRCASKTAYGKDRDHWLAVTAQTPKWKRLQTFKRLTRAAYY
jgi:hypothetical protein